ncbi:MAG: hypothetical protein WBD58_04940 [Geitlerinemataceae cyanobacterium]
MPKPPPESRLTSNKFKKMAPKLSWRDAPKIAKAGDFQGSSMPTANIQWNTPTIIVFTLFIGLPYIGATIAAFNSGVMMWKILMVVAPILLGIFIGLLNYWTRHLR